LLLLACKDGNFDPVETAERRYCHRLFLLDIVGDNGVNIKKIWYCSRNGKIDYRIFALKLRLKIAEKRKEIVR